MDEELKTYLEDMEKRLTRQGWETARVISYYSIDSRMRKGLPIKKFIPFAWDDEEDESE